MNGQLALAAILPLSSWSFVYNRECMKNSGQGTRQPILILLFKKKSTNKVAFCQWIVLGKKERQTKDKSRWKMKKT